MARLDSSDFQMHIESKDRITTGQRAKHLYGQYTYDHALPQSFINEMNDMGFEDIGAYFVWLYFDHSIMGIPAPLNLEACEMLKEYELKGVKGVKVA